jgi:acyl-CoA synthetase (AMP-forming)/AMP-acid ligase II
MQAEGEVGTVGDIARHWSHVSPHAIALEDGTATLTYRQLDERANQFAAYLTLAGVRKGEVVSALLPNGCDYVAIVLAVARAGAILCPLNPRFTAHELARLVRVAKPVRMVVNADRHAVLSDPQLMGLCPRERMISLADAEVRALAKAELPPIDTEDFFSLMYTSGTTGEPKGALATHRARRTWINSAIREYGITRDDVYLSAMPLVHSAGMTMALTHLQAGARVRIMPRFDAAELLGAIEREQVTSVLAVPTMLSMLMAALDSTERAHDLSSIRRVITCGAPLSQKTKSAVLSRISSQLYDFYGSTECNSMTVLKPCDQMQKARSVGRPFANVEIMVAGSSGEALQLGQIGEVWSRNPSTMSRYLNLPEATAAAFSGHWYRTGDLGYLDEDGYLYLAGRVQEMIISGGMNIFPPEIENVLMEHPSVRDCAVVGVPDETWGQVVKAFIAPRGEALLSLSDVQSHCCRQLADFKKPRQIEIVAEIPRNAGGKIVKAALTSTQHYTA